MKAKEIMIGDFVTFKDSLEDAAVLPVKILGIGFKYGDKEDDALVSIDGDDVGDLIDLDDEIVGIPITDEILKKNGFEKANCGVGATIYTFSDNDEFYALAIDEYTDSIWRVEYTNCEFNFPLCRNLVSYVHELQHVFRLCGIEKEITL